MGAGWTGTRVLDLRHARWLHIDTKKHLSQLARATFQEGETLLLRNSIKEEEEEEEEEDEEEEDEDISKSYITNGTHPPAPPIDRRNNTKQKTRYPNNYYN